jgi:peptide/nickel transport system permease protein
MKMWIYVVRRVLLLVPVIIGVMTITFAIVSALPTEQRLISWFGLHPHPGQSDPYATDVPCSSIGINQPGNCPNPVYARDIAILGLNKPIPAQWGIYVGNAFIGNWGTTNPSSTAVNVFPLPQNAPVLQVLSWFLPYTLELAFLSLALIILLAIPLGNYSAVYRNRPLDQGTRVISFSGYAMPVFLLGTLVLVAATYLGGGFVSQCHGYSNPYNQFYNSWPVAQCLPGAPSSLPSFIGPYDHTTPTGFPTVDAMLYGGSQGWYLAGDSLFRLVLPALVIAYGYVAIILRYVRNSMLEVMNLDFVRTARSKGVPEAQVVRRHAGRNSLNVTVTVLGLTFAFFISGFPVIENVFHLKGIGLILAYSVNNAINGGYDFGLIFGTTLLFTIVVVVANIIVDILYAYLDPRVRLG